METIASVTGFADLIVRPTGVLLLGTALALLMRSASAASRHLVWSASQCAVLAIPLLGPVSPEVSVPIGAEVAEFFERTAWTGGAPTDAAGDRSMAPAPVATRAEAEPSGIALPWRSIWLAGCLGFLAVLGTRLVMLHRVERSARRADEGQLVDLLESAKRHLHVERPVRLLLGEPAAMPMTWGHRSPRILLPQTALDWPSERTHAVLVHELAHVKRGDVLLQRIAEVARAVFWFNPLAWYATHRMLVEREHACDDAVIRSGVRGSDYAHQLLAMAHTLRSTGSVAAALPMARRSQMTGRLLAILDEERSRRPSPASGAMLVLVLGVSTGLAVAGVRPTPLEATNPSTATSEQEVAEPRVAGQPDAGRPVAGPPAPASLAGVSGCWPTGSNTSSNRNQDPGVIEAEWRTDRCEGGLRIVGRAVLRSDLGGFAHLDSGTRVKVGEREDGGPWLKMELVGMPDGRILRHGTRGDREVEAREIDAWLASNLGPLLQLTGVRLQVAESSP